MADPTSEERIAQLETQLAAQRRLVDAIPHMVWMTDESGKPTFLNARCATYGGADLARAEVEGTRSFIHPEDRPHYEATASAGRAHMAPFELVMRLRRHDGTYRRHLCRFQPLTPGAPGPWAATGTDVEDEHRFEEQQEFLVQAGKRLGASLDSKETLQDVAKLLVPRIADWFAVDLATPDGLLERVAMEHVDPSKMKMAWEFHRRMPPRPEDPGGIYAVLRSGAPEVFEEIPDELLAQSILDPEVLAMIRGLGLRSSMCVPLVAGDRTVGTLTLVSAESNRSYGDRDLAFAKALAARIAIAVENARLFEHTQQARIASETLAADVIEQSRAAQELVVAMRRERDAALAKLGQLESR
ncbi:MAG: Phytochrome, two-component sensor histidine kinase [Labilithrix sp.]|nr:Phytochrome, two-component sensor histidine kinase [Labilithrix sp.]